MAKKSPPVGSASEILALFDPQERAALLDEFGIDAEAVPARFTAHELLRWIVARRSAFIHMAGDIGAFLEQVENAVRGNVEFLVTEHHGRELALHFGPQIRRRVAAAVGWADHPPPDMDAKLGDLRRSVHRFCDEARPRSVQRDSSLGRTLRDMSRMHPDPREQMKYGMQADMLRQSHYEFNPADASSIRLLAEEFERKVSAIAERVATDSPDLGRLISQLRALQRQLVETARRATEIQFDAFVAGNDEAKMLETACEKTGGRLVRIG